MISNIIPVYFTAATKTQSPAALITVAIGRGITDTFDVEYNDDRRYMSSLVMAKIAREIPNALRGARLQYIKVTRTTFDAINSK